MAQNNPKDSSIESGVSSKECFEQSYRNFLDALRLMTESSDVQCKIMDYYNVAWELKDDVNIGHYLLKISSGFLSDIQQSAIQNFLDEVEELPDYIFDGATTKKDNLRAMRNSSWKSIRAQANQLIRLLKPATMKNEAYFGGSKKGRSNVS